ncbi:hypothetical protein ACGFWD_15570 [Streptomyces sp. NPDC048448]|uniref:hypothetical protein n=1 Tax=Streptomyces sp. NPDC048448 TaxID=3365554 RepID=UPI003713DD5D
MAGDERPVLADGQIAFPEHHPDPDGSHWLFEFLLDPTPEAFRTFAEDYYEVPVDVEAVRDIYASRRLGLPQIVGLNPEASLPEVVAAARAMGYPLVDDLRPDAS